MSLNFQVKAQDVNLNQKVSLQVQGLTLLNTIDSLKIKYKISFAYSNEPGLNTVIKYQFSNVSLGEVLNHILSDADIEYKILAGQVVLKKKSANKINFLSGYVLDKNKEPVIFCNIGILNKSNVTISDTVGYFELLGEYIKESDTLVFSSLNYKTRKVLISEFIDKGEILLEKNVFEIPVVSIDPKEFKLITLGNERKRSKDDLYLDTSGQQVALFIENEKDRYGRIKAVYFYFNENGNRRAPFRVRLYKPDENTFQPGVEIIQQPIVIYPEFASGWFKVNLEQFKVGMPEDGIFIAIQGVYPEYNIKSEKTVKSVNYGHRIGYSRNNRNNTWHYSMANTWFQLEDSNLDVMIKADIIVKKKRK